jgi:hypothetical protein
MINFKGKKAGIPLIWMIIAIGAFVFAFGLIAQGYGQFIQGNNGTLDTSFLQHYNDIYAKNANLQTESIGAWATVKGFSYAVVTGVFAGINILVNTLLTLADSAMTSTKLINELKSVYSGIDILFSFLTFVCTVYIAYKLIQLYRGTIAEI